MAVHLVSIARKQRKIKRHNCSMSNEGVLWRHSRGWMLLKSDVILMALTQDKLGSIGVFLLMVGSMTVG